MYYSSETMNTIANINKAATPIRNVTRQVMSLLYMYDYSDVKPKSAYSFWLGMLTLMSSPGIVEWKEKNLY